jgi:hypothetical protein
MEDHHRDGTVPTVSAEDPVPQGKPKLPSSTKGTTIREVAKKAAINATPYGVARIAQNVFDWREG